MSPVLGPMAHAFSLRCPQPHSLPVEKKSCPWPKYASSLICTATLSRIKLSMMCGNPLCLAINRFGNEMNIPQGNPAMARMPHVLST